jgi:hypothetical protein
MTEYPMGNNQFPNPNIQTMTEYSIINVRNRNAKIPAPPPLKGHLNIGGLELNWNLGFGYWCLSVHWDLVIGD